MQKLPPPKLELKLPTLKVTWGSFREIRTSNLYALGVTGRTWASSFITSMLLLSFVKCFKLPGSQNGSHSGVIALLFLTYVMYIRRTFLWDKFNVSHFYKFDNTKTQRNVSKFQQRRHKRTATSMHRGACVVSQSVESDSL